MLSITTMIVIAFGLAVLYPAVKEKWGEWRAKVAREKKIEGDFFEKKVECAKYVEKVQKELDDENEKNFKWNLGSGISERKQLIQVCYSPVLDACVSEVEEVTTRNAELDERVTAFTNLLTGADIKSFNYATDWRHYHINIVDERARLNCSLN